MKVTIISLRQTFVTRIDPAVNNFLLNYNRLLIRNVSIDCFKNKKRTVLSDHMFTGKSFISNKMHLCNKSNRPHVAMCKRIISNRLCSTRVLSLLSSLCSVQKLLNITNCFSTQTAPLQTQFHLQSNTDRFKTELRIQSQTK